MGEMRIEKDTMGELEVPVDRYYGCQTARSLLNFDIGDDTMPVGVVRAFGILKQAAAKTNVALEQLDPEVGDLVIAAAQEVIDGHLNDHFPLRVWQTGSGTQSNMNSNEVIANRAIEIAGGEMGSKHPVHPNDHVNRGQSSNDTFPTAMHIAGAEAFTHRLLPSVRALRDALDAKAKAWADIVKIGRTHLMDAMPIDFSQELSGWKAQLESNKKSLVLATQRMNDLPQGGTAIGTGINTHKDFSKTFCAEVNKLAKFKTKPAKNFFQGLSSVDNAVELSSALKNLSIILMKISNDLRWMNSGPLTGLGEIELEALQPGSSIMPGKVNPVIPEAVAMACADVIGNDVTVTLAGQSGNFQLNVMLPVVAYNLLKSINLLGNAMPLLANKSIKTFKINSKNINESLSKNPILVTALNRIIGYSKAAAVAKKAYKEGKSIVDVAHEETGISKAELEKLLDPAKLTKGGISG